MKSYNKQLLATSGLFVAFMGLTSFNPFTDTNHVTALQKEESISLAVSSATDVDRKAEDSAVGTTRNRDPKLVAQINLLPKERDAKAAQSQVTTGEGVVDDVLRKVKERKEAAEGGVNCEDGKCADSATQNQTEILARISEKIKTNAPLTAEETRIVTEQFIKKDGTSGSTPEANTLKCAGDGSSTVRDYKARVSCFLDAEKEFKKQGRRRSSDETPEDRAELAQEIEEFIIEVTYDEGLKARHVSQILNKLNRSQIVRTDRELDLKGSIRAAIAYTASLKERDIFERNLERATEDIAQIDDQIEQAMQANGGQRSYQSEMLMIERKNAVYNLEKEIAGFQHVYRQSLPSARNSESTLIAQLRDDMSADYQDLISPVASVITDRRLTSLDKTSFSMSNPMVAQNGMSGSVYSSFDARGGSQFNGGNQFNGGRTSYNGMDPYMANANTSMLSQMSPAQQIQQMRNSNNMNQMPMNQIPMNQPQGSPVPRFRS